MKILLIQPDKSPMTIGGEDIHLSEPLALEYVAAGVIDYHDVEIFDLRLEKGLKAKLSDFAPDVVGFTAYTVHVNRVIDLLRQVKLLNPDVFSIVGGHHATVAPEDFSIPDVDAVIRGEGVFAFRELISRLEAGTNAEGIPGIDTPPEQLVDLDAFPFPARHLTQKYRKHYFSEWMKPLASMRTSKGCPYRCNFCALWKLTGGKYLKRSPESIVRELATIEEDYVFFADDESLVDVDRMHDLAIRIKDAGIDKRYFLYGRSDTICKNSELLKLWKQIGLKRIFMGIEFFRDEDLEYINKKSSIQQNEEALRILRELDIDVYASFIVRPEFTKDDFQEFRQYCRGLDLSFCSFAVLTPLPGTDLFEQEKDRLITGNNDLFDFLHTVLPTALPLEDFQMEFRGLYVHTMPLNRRLAFLAKYPVRDFPSTIIDAGRFYRRLKRAHLDYN